MAEYLPSYERRNFNVKRSVEKSQDKVDIRYVILLVVVVVRKR